MSAISPGEIVITDPDNQKQNIDDLRRDTTDTNTSLPGIPDLQKILSEQLKTQQLYDDAAAKAAKMIGDYASERYTEAYKNDNKAEMEFWKEGGNGPAILHAIAGGLLGGLTDFSGMLSGMAGGAMSAKLAPEIHKLVEQFVKDAGVTGSAADLMVNTITGSILQGLGAVTGGTGAAYAGNAYQNNYLKHAEREEFDKARFDCSQGNQEACKIADDLRQKSYERDELLDRCRGDYSNECQQARAELRYAAAEYIDLARKGLGDPSSPLYYSERHMVFVGAAKYADEKDTYVLPQELLSSLSDPKSLQIATGNPQEVSQALRGPISLGLIAGAALIEGGLRPRGTIKREGGNVDEIVPSSRKATSADVESYFQQNRQYWSNDPIVVSGNKVYQRNDLIDPKYVDPRTGKTNLELMQSGRAPIGPDGNPINLHHMTQSQTGPIAELTQTFHQKNSSTIHINGSDIPSGINRAEFSIWRRDYWKNRANDF